MLIEPIAYFRSPLTSKFGIPRQGGLAQSLEGFIVFEPPYRHAEAVRGLDAFSHLWIIWEFSANRHTAVGLTVRPPRLGGNERVGVFASRSPFRPNGLGLTCAYIKKVEMDERLGPVIYVGGADLMDGTPIYDLKPYVRYADCHPDAISGFVDQCEWHLLQVEIADEWATVFTTDEQQALREVLSLDPRPRYHNDSHRIYGMPFAGYDVRFRVADGVAVVVEVLRQCDAG
jgi:tRNA-Thr(GGU) m(6)t(6)A37 methyltransferase TsaA